MMLLRKLFVPLAALLCVVLPTPGFCTGSCPPTAPAPTIYAADEDGAILRVNFEFDCTAVVNTDAGVHDDLRGIVIRDDGVKGTHLIVSAKDESRILFYKDSAGDGLVITDDIPKPEEAALDAAGNIYVANRWNPRVFKIERDTSCLLELNTNPDCTNGGYRKEPVTIDPDFPGEEPEDSLIVPFTQPGLTRGDLLVLSEKDPPRVYRYPGATPCLSTGCVDGTNRKMFIAESEFGGDNPDINSMAFLDRILLITSEQGKVYRFDTSGHRVLPDFALLSGDNHYRVAVGGDRRVYFSKRDDSGSAVLRFNVQSNGTGVFDKMVLADEPAAVDVTTSTTVELAAGSTDFVEPTNVSEVACKLPDETGQTGSGWTASGALNGRLLVFTDTRLGADTVADDQPLATEVRLQDIDPSLTDQKIPKWVRALRKLKSGDPPTGPGTGEPTFILITMVTADASCPDPLELHGVEAAVLGYDPEHNKPEDRTAEPRFFYSPCFGPPFNEPPILENPFFRDITSGIGSTRGHTRDTSCFLHSRDVRPIDGPPSVNSSNTCTDWNGTSGDGSGDCELRKLREASANICIASGTRNKLKKTVKNAITAWNRHNYSGAQQKIDSYYSTVRANPGAFTSGVCASNRVSQDLQARALALSFKIGKLF